MAAVAPRRIEEVSPGDRVLEPVFSAHGELLLEAGNTIGVDGLLRLTREGVVRLQVQSPDEASAPAAPENVVDHCVTCGAGLALRPPHGKVDCKPYACKACGDVYIAAFDDKCTGVHCGPERVFCTRQGCDHMCEKLLGGLPVVPLAEQVYVCETIKRVFSGGYDGPERRESKRHPLNSVVLTVPLDGSFRVVGRAFAARTRDISFTGVGLLLDRPVQAEAYVIDFSPDKVSGLRMVAKVAWESLSLHGSSVGAAFCGRLDPRVGSLTALGAS